MNCVTLKYDASLAELLVVEKVHYGGTYEVSSDSLWWCL